MNKMKVDEAIIQSSQRQKGFGFGKVIFVLILACLIGVLSSTVNFDAPSPYRLPVTGLLVGIMLFLSGFRIGKVSKMGLIVLFFWFGYATLCFSSAIINGDNLIGEAWQLLGVAFLVFCGIPYYAGRQGVQMVALAIAFGFAPYIIASLLTNPVRLTYYEGVFGNPNTMGIVLVAWLSGLLCLLRGFIPEAKRKILHAIYIGLLVAAILLTLFLIIASSSRTSLSTAGFLLLIFVWSLFLDAAKNRLWVKLVIISTAVMLLFVLLSGGTASDGLLGNMLKKFDKGLISGRDVIWHTVISGAAPFGHGNMYFADKVGDVAHNNYIDVLGSKGIIALLFRVPFDILVVLLAFRLTVKNVKQDGYAVGPLMVILCYLVVGMGETVNGTLGHGIHMSYLLMIGMLINYPQYHPDNCLAKGCFAKGEGSPIQIESGRKK